MKDIFRSIESPSVEEAAERYEKKKRTNNHATLLPMLQLPLPK